MRRAARAAYGPGATQPANASEVRRCFTRQGAPRRTRSMRTRRTMSAGPHAQVSLLFTRRPRRRKPPGSKRVLAEVRRTTLPASTKREPLPVPPGATRVHVCELFRNAVQQRPACTAALTPIEHVSIPVRRNASPHSFGLAAAMALEPAARQLLPRSRGHWTPPRSWLYEKWPSLLTRMLTVGYRTDSWPGRPPRARIVGGDEDTIAERLMPSIPDVPPGRIGSSSTVSTAASRCMCTSSGIGTAASSGSRPSRLRATVGLLPRS